MSNLGLRRLEIMKIKPTSYIVYIFLLSIALNFWVSASDLRPPLIGLEGPLRFIPEVEVRDDSSIKFWTTVNNRQASKAFMDHGATVVDYTNLIFNKDNFRVTDIFTDSYVPSQSESYLSLLRTARLNTEASYSETAVIFGMQWMYPVYEDRGRFGLRARLPVKYVEIKRENLRDIPGGAQLEDVVAVQPASSVPGGTGSSRQLPSSVSTVMRFDMAESLVQSNDLNLIFNFDGAPRMAGTDLSGNDADPKKTAQMRLAVVSSPVGDVPNVPNVPTNVAVALNAISQIPSTYEVLPADGKIAANKVYVFDSVAGKYKGLLDDNASDATTRRENQLTKESMWLIPFGYEDTTVGSSEIKMAGTESGGSMNILKSMTSRVTENVPSWLLDRKYEFESSPRQGCGDVQIEAFYQQDFVPNVSSEFVFGVGIPVDRDNQFFMSPYKPRLGNGGHWDVFFGAGLGFVFNPLCNFRLHGRYSIILPEVEEVCATFKNTLVKGIGPRALATVDWKYATINLDCTLFHPDSKTCSAVLGYQLFWKGRDNVSYKDAEAETWLGKKYNVSTRQFEPNLKELDALALSINTDSIAHRFRMEVSLRIGSYCEMLFGGAYTIFGKHVACDLDTHFGVHLTF